MRKLTFEKIVIFGALSISQILKSWGRLNIQCPILQIKTQAGVTHMSDYKSGVQEEHGHSYLRFIYLNLGTGLQISTGGWEEDYPAILWWIAHIMEKFICSLQIYLHKIEL